MRRSIDIRTLLDIPQWEKVQDVLAEATGTAIVTIDYKGIPVTKHSGRSEFCGVIRDNSVTRKLCYKCDSLAGLEAVRLNKPFIYLCHCNVVDVAVPVTVDDKYLGAVMFGQVRLPNGEPNNQVERLINELSSFSLDDECAAEKLKSLYNKLPVMGYDHIERIANLLYSVVQYIIIKALEHDSDNLRYEWLLNSFCESTSELKLPPSEIHPLTKQNNFEDEDDFEIENVQKGSAIYPAITYINEHMNEMVKMADMASLCHLSPSYFSRVFLREVGENFIDYTNRRKIEASKRMLKTDSLSIARISNSLGYQDPSYFVKLFKRYEGITPLMYKKQINR